MSPENCALLLPRPAPAALPQAARTQQQTTLPLPLLLLCAKLISFAAVLIRQKRRLNFRHQTKRSVFDKVPTSYSGCRSANGNGNQPACRVACFCLPLLIAPLKVEQPKQGTKLAKDNYCTKAAL